MSAPGGRAGVWGREDTTPAHLHAAPQVPVAPGGQSWPPAPAAREQVRGERHGAEESRNTPRSFSSTCPAPGGFSQEKPENFVQ